MFYNSPATQLEAVLATHLASTGLAIVGTSLFEPDDALPVEIEITRRWAEGRQREFLAGRSCARRALRTLGWPDQPILRQTDRTPRWPAGVVGSISHCDDYCVAAVSDARDIEAMGIDVEPRGAVDGEVASMVVDATERRRFNSAFEDWRTGVFCMKEAAFKAVYPGYGELLEFGEVKLNTGTRVGSFIATAAPSVRDGFAPVEGLCIELNELVIAAAWRLAETK
jgi:4'-phosphopantetheinyl transferase EntD